MTSVELVKIKLDSALAQTQLTTLQNVIQRMASNSANCKTWCVTLVSAILVLAVDKSNSQIVWIPIFPIIAFAALDIYYLAMEKAFRNTYNNFVKKLHSGELTASDFDLTFAKEKTCYLQRKAINSFSIWGFYLMLIALVAITNIITSG